MSTLFSSLRRRLLACVLIACLVPLGACSSMKTIQPVTAPGAPTYGPLKAGDTVVVQTRDRERWRFVVEAIEGDVIVAPGGVRYEREELIAVQRKTFSGPKTAGLVAGIVGGFLLMVGMATAAALDGVLSGGA